MGKVKTGGMEMRIKEKIENINYQETKQFFSKRATKYKENNPYSVTMYQDNNADLVKARNKKEIEKLLPKLSITQESKVLLSFAFSLFLSSFS